MTVRNPTEKQKELKRKSLLEREARTHFRRASVGYLELDKVGYFEETPKGSIYKSMPLELVEATLRGREPVMRLEGEELWTYWPVNLGPGYRKDLLIQGPSYHIGEKGNIVPSEPFPDVKVEKPWIAKNAEEQRRWAKEIARRRARGKLARASRKANRR